MMRVLLIFLLPLALLNCSTPKEKIPPAPDMASASGKVMIYQLLPRLFGNKSAVNKPHGTIQENGCGKFNDITDEALQSIKELGITHVWYTGVLEHATMTDYSQYGISRDDADVVKGRAGSPYAIKDYYDIDPDLAVNVEQRMQEFEQLVSRTHANGLKVLIDFVPNHVARRYHSDAKPEGVKDLGEGDDTSKAFSPTNNFYYLPGESFRVPVSRNQAPENSNHDGRFDETPAKVTGNDKFTASPAITDWYETVKLNYGVDIQDGGKTYFDPVPDTWNKMKDILVYWTNKSVDGFRCDMAEMVPVEFWQWVIPQIKSINPDVLFIAEIYNPDQYRSYLDQGRFDYLYDKVLLYDTLRLAVKNGRHAQDISSIRKRLSDIDGRLLHFTENHDEQRMASRYFAGDIWNGTPAMLISATIDQGPVMIYFGQEVGESAVGAEGFSDDDGRTTIFDYWGVPEHQKWMNNGKFDGGQLTMEQQQLRMFYSDVLNLAGKNDAIIQGDFIDLTPHNLEAGNITDDVYVFVRHFEDERLLIISSFNKETKAVTIQVPEHLWTKMGLDLNNAYIARDLIWREVEVGFDSKLSFELNIKPYSTFILKIK